MDEFNFAYLPYIPSRKILKYYILEKSLNSGIKWTNEHEQINYFPMFCHIWDNLVPNGFVKIDSKITFDLIRKRFPNTKLVEPANLRKIIDNDSIDKVSLIGSFTNETKQTVTRSDYQLLLAGGYFTRYSDNLFTKKFPVFYKHFVNSQDIDNLIFYSPVYSTAEYSTIYSTRSMFRLFQYKNFNTIETVHRKSYNDNCAFINRFDFDCCKLI